jgi:GDPmannose 4,6-dehydratase
VEAMQLMLAHDTPEDFVIATGNLHSVREFLDIAFGAVGLAYAPYVKVNEKYLRKQEAVPLVGDASKAKNVLGWSARKPFAEMVEEMVAHDVALIKGTK